MQRYFVFFTLVVSLIVVFTSVNKDQENEFLSTLLNKNARLATCLENSDTYSIQLLYTKIDRDEQNHPSFETHSYRLDSDEYFYPASTVKLPVAIMALEKLNTLSVDGLNLDTRMEIDSAFSGQSAVKLDSSSASGYPSIGHYIKKLLLVSDNDAFNRLYEFVGQEAINQSLQNKGLTDSRILHRLSIALSEEENRHTNPMRFYQGENLVYEQPLTINGQPIAYPNEILKGKGEMIGGTLVNKPKDFSTKNRFPIKEQHDLMKGLFFPGVATDLPTFNLHESDYQFLYQYMSQFPRETNSPAYDPEHYYDSYVKFFLFGDNQDSIPDHIRVFNKVGLAYGYLIDNAFVVDFEAGVEFFLTAVIFVNENQIFNDDTYEYDTIGFPFLAELGREIYQYELERERTHRPDLSRFKVDYDR